MKFVVAVHGSRGDVEPCAAIALELARRGHDVRMVVPPNLVDLIRSTGLTSVTAWGPDSQGRVLYWDSKAVARWKESLSGGSAPNPNPGAQSRRWVNPVEFLRLFKAYLADGWLEMSRTLMAQADGADVILTGMTYQEVAANVAEKLGIRLATVHYFPVRANSVILPVKLPSGIVERGFAITEWGYWQFLRNVENEQRRELGLPSATARSARRIVDAGTLEIQAYDAALFPGLDEQWHGSRPFVGALTLELQTEADDDVAAWIDAGSPPIYFGFGSTPVEDPAGLLDMIESVCAELGERALVNASSWTVDLLPKSDQVKVIKSANFPMVFPRCRVLVHHGGSGTVAEGLRAGIPTVVLWSTADQPLWAGRIRELKIGTAEKFSRTTRASLLAALREVLKPEYASRARAVAKQMTKPSEGVAKAADLLENAAAATSSKR